MTNSAPITCCAEGTVIARIRHDQVFTHALACEAASALLRGDSKTARVLLRTLVNATIEFEELASRVAKPSKSLHRMLSVRGNPSMNTLSLVLHTLCQHLGIRLDVKSHLTST